MKRILILIAFLLALAPAGRGQELPNFGEVPVEITAENTSFAGGLAVAQQNVVIHYGSSTIYADYAQYNPDTRDLLVTGNVRIYQPDRVFLGDRAVYNLETKQLHGADFSGDFMPFRFSGETIFSGDPKEFTIGGGVLTTSDSSKPDYRLRAKTIRVYQNDRIVFTNVTLFVGNTPVFWFPYLYQSLKQDTGYTILPTYQSIWGASVLASYAFPLWEGFIGRLRLDLYQQRGTGVGFESKGNYGPDNKSWYRFRSYYIDDLKPETNKTIFSRQKISPERYRVSLQDRTYFSDDIYASVDINKLSDALFLQDFARIENRLNPEPDNVVSLTKWNEDYTVTALARFQANNFFDTTERLPELALDVKSQPLFHSPVFYDGETSAANLRLNFQTDWPYPDYRAFRLDSFHQLSLPETFFDFLSFVPRIGVRGTYYSKTGQTVLVSQPETVKSSGSNQQPTIVDIFSEQLLNGPAVFRPGANAGFESSFKFSRAYESVESRAWGLDGLRHVVQPYTDLSYSYVGKNPNGILQFDRFIPSDQLPIFDFPEFTSIDSISNWAIWRFGVRNRFETRRDDATFTWLETDSFFDINMEKPDFPGNALGQGTLSNFYNRVRWSPLSWLGLTVDSQVPLDPKGFYELNTSFNFFVNKNTQISLGNRYISGSPSIPNDSDITFGGNYHLNDNWGFSVQDDYNTTAGMLLYQRYSIHRDLSSWLASLEFLVDNNGSGAMNYGVILSFTVKDAPAMSIGTPEVAPSSLVDSGAKNPF